MLQQVRVICMCVLFSAMNILAMDNETRSLVRIARGGPVETLGYACAQKFYERLGRTCSELMHDGVQAYYKKIGFVSAKSKAKDCPWHFTAVSIDDKQLYPNEDGTYADGDIFFASEVLESFHVTRGLDIPVVYNEKRNKIHLNKILEKKVLALPRFDSYKDLITILDNNKLSLMHYITLRGSLRTSEGKSQKLLIEIENECNQSINLQGMEIVCNKSQKTTKIFFDFTDQNGDPIDYFSPVEFKHSKTIADDKVICIKDHRVYGCQGKKIYGLFDSLTTRDKWVLDEANFYDHRNKKLIPLPGCYGDSDCHQEVCKDHIVWVFREDNSSFYRLDGSKELVDTNKYIYRGGGVFCMTLPYKARYKECFSKNNITQLDYLVRVSQPFYSIKKDVLIEGGHREWSTGIYEREYLGNKSLWRKIGTVAGDIIKFCSKDVKLDSFFSDQPLQSKHIKQSCDAAQRFLKHFSAVICCCDKNVARGLSAWNKLTVLDLSCLKLDNLCTWNNVFDSLGTMTQLKSLHFEKNHPVADFFDPCYFQSSNDASDYYCSLAACLGKLSQLKQLHIQGLWLKPQEELGENGLHVISPQVAMITGIVNHKQQAGVKALLKSISAMKGLEDLSMDSIPNYGNADIARRTPAEHIVALPFVVLSLPFQLRDHRSQGKNLKDLVSSSAKQLADMKSLKKMTIYTPAGRYADYFSKGFAEQLRACRPTFAITTKELQ